MKRYSVWFKAAIVFQFLTAFIHSLSFVVKTVPKNETEQQILDLMTTHRLDMGLGFHPSMRDLMTALSSCFALLYLFGGLVNTYLIRKKVGEDVLKGFVAINVIVFGVCFVIMFVFTFIAPVALTGITFLLLIITYLLIKPETKE